MTRIFRPTWAILTWLFLLMIPIQFYLAGRGAFAFHDTSASSREATWQAHYTFGYAIALVVLLALLAAVAGRLPGRLLRLTGVLFVLMLVQIALAELGASTSTRWLGALHPVNAILLTGLGIDVTMRSRAYLPFERFRSTPPVEERDPVIAVPPGG